MTPTQQIIPGPRIPDGRNSGRSTAIELSRPGVSNRPQPEATVNYAALLRRHEIPTGPPGDTCLVFSG